MSRDLSENALGQPGSDTNCWNRTADTRRVRRDRPHTRRAHPGCRAATHAPIRIAAGFRSLGPTLPQKASLSGGCTLNLINHAITLSPHNVGLFPTLSPDLLKSVPNELLVVEIRLVDLLKHPVEHLGGARPDLVRTGTQHGLLVLPAPTRERRTRPHVRELPQEECEEDNHEEDVVGVPEVQPGHRH
jgi:hypothetical protein